MTIITINERKSLQRYANPANVRDVGYGKFIVHLPIQDPRPIVEFANMLLGSIYARPMHDVCAAFQLDTRSGVMRFELIRAYWGLRPMWKPAQTWVSIEGYAPTGLVRIDTHETIMGRRMKDGSGYYRQHIRHETFRGNIDSYQAAHPAYQALASDMRDSISPRFVNALSSLLLRHKR